MEDHEFQRLLDDRAFQRLLDHFPVIRSRNYCAGSELSGGSTSGSAQDEITQPKNAQNEVDDQDGSAETANDGVSNKGGEVV